MTIASAVTALASSIGADIKALLASLASKEDKGAGCVYIEDHGAVGNYRTQLAVNGTIVDCKAAIDAAYAEAITRRVPVKSSGIMGGDFYIGSDLAAIPNELVGQARFIGNGKKNTVLWHRTNGGSLFSLGTGADGVAGSSTNSDQDWGGFELQDLAISAVKDNTEINETARKVADGVCVGFVWRHSAAVLDSVHIEGYYKAVAGLAETSKSWSLHMTEVSFAHNFISVETTEHALVMDRCTSYFGETAVLVKGSSGSCVLNDCDLSAQNNYCVRFVTDSTTGDSSGFVWKGGYCENGYSDVDGVSPKLFTGGARSINKDLKTSVAPTGMACFENGAQAPSFYGLHVSLQAALNTIYVNPSNRFIKGLSVKNSNIRRDTRVNEVARIIQYESGSVNVTETVFEDNTVPNGTWSNVTNDTSKFVKLDYQGVQLVPKPIENHPIYDDYVTLAKTYTLAELEGRMSLGVVVGLQVGDVTVTLPDGLPVDFDVRLAISRPETGNSCTLIVGDGTVTPIRFDGGADLAGGALVVSEKGQFGLKMITATSLRVMESSTAASPVQRHELTFKEGELITDGNYRLTSRVGIAGSVTLVGAESTVGTATVTARISGTNTGGSLSADNTAFATATPTTPNTTVPTDYLEVNVASASADLEGLSVQVEVTPT